jgi:hypothetical protein
LTLCDARALTPLARRAQDRSLSWIVNGEIYNHKKLKARAQRATKRAAAPAARVAAAVLPPLSSRRVCVCALLTRSSARSLHARAPQVLIDAQTPSDSDSEIVGCLYEVRRLAVARCFLSRALSHACAFAAPLRHAAARDAPLRRTHAPTTLPHALIHPRAPPPHTLTRRPLRAPLCFRNSA